MTTVTLAQNYLLKATKRLKILRVLLDEDDFSDVVREAQEIVELAQKGMLRWVGRADWARKELARVVGYLPQFPSFEEEQSVGDVLRLGRVPHLGAFGFESAVDTASVENSGSPGRAS